MEGFRADFYPGTSLSNVDGAIKAAKDGCSFYEWLLDFVIRSRFPEDLVGSEELFMKRHCIPKIKDDVYSVSFLVGTAEYAWPCATFDVFTEDR
jgi:hypothetical protein